MKPYPLITDTPPEIAGEILHSEHIWTLADVLEWFAGKPCNYVIGPGENHCPKCYADPPAEYGRDVLAAFIMAGGAMHPKQVEHVNFMLEFAVKEYNDGGTSFWYVYPDILSTEDYRRHLTPDRACLAMKLRILRLFSGPVSEGGVRIVCRSCAGVGIVPEDKRISDPILSQSFICPTCKGRRQLTPEQLLEPSRSPAH